MEPYASVHKGMDYSESYGEGLERVKEGKRMYPVKHVFHIHHLEFALPLLVHGFSVHYKKSTALLFSLNGVRVYFEEKMLIHCTFSS